jgi:hypothetical protein
MLTHVSDVVSIEDAALTNPSCCLDRNDINAVRAISGLLNLRILNPRARCVRQSPSLPRDICLVDPVHCCHLRAEVVGAPWIALVPIDWLCGAQRECQRLMRSSAVRAGCNRQVGMSIAVRATVERNAPVARFPKFFIES